MDQTMTQEERVKNVQLSIAKSMKVDAKSLAVMEKVEDWEAREWLYVCALDQIDLQKLAMALKGKLSSDNIRRKRKEMLRDTEATEDYQKEIEQLHKEVMETCRESQAIRKVVQEFVGQNEKKKELNEIIEDRNQLINELQRKNAELEKKLQEKNNKQDDEKNGMDLSVMKKKRRRLFWPRAYEAKKFIEAYLQDDRYSSEQVDFFLECFEEGMRPREIERIAIPGASLEVMQRLKKLEIRR